MAKTHWKDIDGKVVSVESMSTRGRLQLMVGFAYKVEDQSYGGKFYTFDLIHEGDSLVVRYDVSNPKHNNLDTKQKRINRTAVAVGVPIVGGLLLLLWFTLTR